MRFVTHLDRVRAAIRSAWPTGVACPPLVVRFRAGSERAGWDTLVELARIRCEHPDDVVVDRLTRAVAVELVSRSVTPEAAETAQHLIAGTLGIVGGDGSGERTAIEAYLAGAAVLGSGGAPR